MRLLSIIRQLPKSIKLACLALIVLMIYLCVAEIDIVSPGSGIITGSEDKIDIVSPGSGFINKFDIKSANQVHQGDILFSYTNLDSFYKEKSLQDLVEFSKQRIAELNTDLELLNDLKSYEFTHNAIANAANITNKRSNITTGNWRNTSAPADTQRIDEKSNSAYYASINYLPVSDVDKNNASSGDLNNPHDEVMSGSVTADASDQLITKTKDTIHATEPVSDQMLLSILDKKFSSYAQDQTLSAFKFYQEYKAILHEKQNQHQRKTEINAAINELSTQIAFLNNKLLLLTKSGAPQVDVINTSADISKIRSQIIQERINLLALNNDMIRSTRDFNDRLLSRIYDADQQLGKLQKEQIENTGELELLKNKIQSNSVEAPVDGVVLDIVKNFAVGTYVEQSQLIMKLKKKQVNTIVEARFDAKYRPFIYNNGEVKVVINTPGYKKYYTGSIAKISADSFTDEKTNLTARFYKVEIKVDNDNFNLDNSNEGIQVSVYAISKRMTIISYLTALVNSNIVFNVW